MLKIKELTKNYNGARGVDDISLELKSGECFGFIGPNGAGKSTTIRCIMNMINKNNGQITIDDKVVSKDDESYKESIGYLPSEIYLYEDLTVQKMLDYSASFYSNDCQPRIKELVKRFKVNEKKKIDELSLGNLKKVGIIIALMHDPKILILDEATSGLDPLMQEEFFLILQEEKKKGTTIFFSSHNLSELKRICDRVGIIKDGKILKIENMKELDMNSLLIVTIQTNDKFDTAKKDIEIIEQYQNKIKFIYKSNCQSLLTLLNKYKIEKVIIEEPSIEEIFMHYYK